MERRSPLPGGRRRERVLRFRVSEEEREAICAAADRAGLAYSAFIVRTVLAAVRGDRSADGHLAELHEELTRLAGQVNRVGVNLNQLTRMAHATVELPEGLVPLAQYLFRVLRRVDAAVVAVGRRLV